MPEVSVDINGRKYRLACEEGQQERLMGLAEQFNSRIEGFKGTFGEIGDNRLTIMAGLAVTDALGEAENRIAALNDEIEMLRRAGDEKTREAESFEQRVAERIGATAEKIEQVANALNGVGRNAPAETA